MFYRFILTIVKGLYKIIFRLKVEGSGNIPAEGPVIICSNHVSFTDAATVAVSCKRAVRFLAKRELFKFKIGNLFFRGLNAIPVDRASNDTGAYKAVLSALEREKAVGIFIQGRFSDLDYGSAKSGAALFALKSRAVLVPAFISGPRGPFSRIIIKYGGPVSFDEYAGKKIRAALLAEVTEKIVDEMERLR